MPDFEETFTDAVGLLDGVTFDSEEALTDAAGLLDGVTPVLDSERTLTDSLGLADGVTRVSEKEHTDAVGLVDAAFVSGHLRPAFADAVAGGVAAVRGSAMRAAEATGAGTAAAARSSVLSAAFAVGGGTASVVRSSPVFAAAFGGGTADASRSSVIAAAAFGGGVADAWRPLFREIYAVAAAGAVADAGSAPLAYASMALVSTSSMGWSGSRSIEAGLILGTRCSMVLNPAPQASPNSVNEQQTIDLGGASGGTFTISFGGFTTAPIPYNATAAQVQAALEALPSINPGDVLVTGNLP